ncbi:Myotubularin 1 [Pelomyxa schiedti]|nr:Myotubularin 1 [Pelomyxa schiedti]
MLCLDPYYRTIVGFEVLLEKEWLSFGHKFSTRYAHGDPKPNEQQAPIFPQMIDCVYQLLCQFPLSFQFNENFLITIMEHLYSCRFGTFLFNCVKEREDASIMTNTVSLWTWVNSQQELFLNPFYAPGDTVLYPDPSLKALRLWEGYHLKWYYKLEADSSVSLAREKRSCDSSVLALKAQLDAMQKEFAAYKSTHTQPEPIRKPHPGLANTHPQPH